MQKITWVEMLRWGESSVKQNRNFQSSFSIKIIVPHFWNYFTYSESTRVLSSAMHNEVKQNLLFSWICDSILQETKKIMTVYITFLLILPAMTFSTDHLQDFDVIVPDSKQIEMLHRKFSDLQWSARVT